MPMMKRVYSVGQVAKILGVARMTIHKMIREKILRSFTTPGGHQRIFGRDIQEFLERHHLPAPTFLGRERRQVLLLGEEPASLKRMADALAGIPGVEIRAAGWGFQAGIAVAEVQPEVIVADVADLERLARDLIPALRSNPELKKTQILAVLPAGDAPDAKRVRKAGANGFVVKPLEPERFRSALEKLLVAA